MRNPNAAEWILSLTIAPDRAASTAGDLLEEAPARGIFWFWSSVLRTASSYVWHDLRASPLRMLGLAFSGLLTSIALCVLVGFFLNGAWKCTADFLGLWGYRSGVYTAGVYALTVLQFTAAGFLVGWLVAERSEGLAAAFAVVALIAAFWAETLCRLATQRRIGHPAPGFELAVFCVLELSVIAGAIRFRRRTLARAKPMGGVHA